MRAIQPFTEVNLSSENKEKAVSFFFNKRTETQDCHSLTFCGSRMLPPIPSVFIIPFHSIFLSIHLSVCEIMLTNINEQSQK